MTRTPNDSTLNNGADSIMVDPAWADTLDYHFDDTTISFPQEPEVGDASGAV